MEYENRMEQHTNNRKSLVIIIVSLCILLVVAIAVTVALLGDRLKDVASSDSDVIELVLSEKGAKSAGSIESKTDTVTGQTGNMDNGTSAGQSVYPAARSDVSRISAADNAPEQEMDPRFSAEDEQQVWTSNTRVDIFHVAYDENGGVTVRSDNDEKVFAPGTTSSYTFKFKNNGDVALDYDMSVTAYITPKEIALPIEAKMNRYDGTWLVGGDADWEPVLKLDGVTDSATLGVNCYAYYTLDWQWPYETADADGDVTEGDIYDTWLGNLAVDEDITLTVVINVIATADTDSGTGSGSGSDTQSVPGTVGGPKTGDDSQILLYIILALASGMVLILFLVRRRRIYVTGFVSEPEKHAVDLDGEAADLAANGRFVAEAMRFGRHRIALKDSTGKELGVCEVKLVHKSGVDGIRFEKDGDVQILTVDNKIIAIEIWLDQDGSRLAARQVKWAAIDKKHFVYIQDGKFAPKNRCNVTPDGLAIDQDNHLEVRY